MAVSLSMIHILSKYQILQGLMFYRCNLTTAILNKVEILQKPNGHLSTIILENKLAVYILLECMKKIKKQLAGILPFTNE